MRQLLIIFIAVFVIWATSGLVLYNIEERGSFGDMFGAVNSLFSGLAFAGLIFTIFLQKKELGLQRNELKMTRKELKGQRKSMELQNVHIDIQNFEGTFFQMLKLHNELLASIDISKANGDVHTGRDCFMKVWRSYRIGLKDKDETSDLDERKEQIDAAYNKLWTKYESEFGHYFRSLYNVIKFIHNSNIKNKKLYTNIVRAQLSAQELLMLMYNCISRSESKFIPLIEEYSLLKHIPERAISDLDKSFFNPNAFV